MYNVTFVKIVESLQNLSYKVLDEWFLKGTVATQQGSDRTSWNVFQKDVEKIVINRGIFFFSEGEFSASVERADLQRYWTMFGCDRSLRRSISRSSALSMFFFRSSFGADPLGSSTCLTAIRRPFTASIPR